MLKLTAPRPRTPTPPSRVLSSAAHRMTALAASATLLSGCIDWGGQWNGGGSGSTTGSQPGTPTESSPDHPLPRPSKPKFAPPELDAAGLARLIEVEAFLAAQYLAAGWQIVATTQTASGDIYDWMDVSSVEGADKEPPPPPMPEEMKLPDGVELQLTELEMDPELERPAGTVPVLRRDFAAYVLGKSDASSLEDFLTDDVAPGDAAGGKDRLYAGMVAGAANRGANATINAFGGSIEPHTMSVLEMVVGCPKQKTPEDPEGPTPMWQYIGIAASRDYATEGFHNFGDSTLRLQVEFFTAGVLYLGDGKGGWAGTKSVTDFIPAKNAPYGPGAIFAPETISTIDGPQFESLFQIKLVDGDWWVGHNGHWLGYYPRRLFDAHPPNLIATQACQVQWYGEVYASSKKLNEEGRPWTWTDMGSGLFADKGPSKAAYFRDPSYVSLDAAGTWSWPNSDPNVVVKDIPTGAGYNPGCYTKTPLSTAPAPWERFFYVGGPGASSLIQGDGSATCK